MKLQKGTEEEDMRRKTVMALALAMVMALVPVPGGVVLAADASNSGLVVEGMYLEAEEGEVGVAGEPDAADSEGSGGFDTVDSGEDVQPGGVLGERISVESGAAEGADAGKLGSEEIGEDIKVIDGETGLESGETVGEGQAEIATDPGAVQEDLKPTNLRWEKGVPNWDQPDDSGIELELYRDGTLIYKESGQSSSFIEGVLKRDARRCIYENGTYQFRVKFSNYGEDSEWAESPELVYARPEQSVGTTTGYWSDSDEGLFCFQGIEGVTKYILDCYVLDGETEIVREGFGLNCSEAMSASMLTCTFLYEIKNFGWEKVRVRVIAISPDPEKLADGVGELSDYLEITIRSLAPFEGAPYELQYTVDTDSATIIGYTGTAEGQLVIPDEIEGKPVTKIEAWAFYGGDFTGDLVLPDSVTEIGARAFDCTGFKGGKLVLPKNLIKIGGAAFARSGFAGDLVLPDGLAKIDGWAFSDCSGFTGNLVLPDSVEEIGAGVFNGCGGFTGSLVLSEHLTCIDASAFKDCKGLTGELRIPASVEYIYQSSFAGCESLGRDIYLTGNLQRVEAVNGIEPASAFARESCANEEITIHAPKGSFAEEYALQYGHSFVADSEPSPEPGPSATPSPEPTPEPGPSATPSPEPTPGPSVTPSPEPNPSATPSPEPTQKPGGSLAPAPSEKVKGEVGDVVPESVMTEEVKTATGCQSVSELVEQLKKLITTEKSANDILSGIMAGNTQVVDVSVLINSNGQWVEATKDTFPKEGVDILLPYPSGANRDGFDFVVGHLIVMGCNGQVPGTMEYYRPEKTESGLKVHVYSASPFVIAWKERVQEPEETQQPSPTQEPASAEEGKASPRTYDDGSGYEAREKASVNPWGILAAIAAVSGGIAVAAVGKRGRKDSGM